ncbi:caspase family protein, partial [Anaeromyxobacter sp. SG66]|uniref:caspase family protein n=2 Tax=unclassified Anaeromyxobacter TaxID=2620896 RepID=UPI002105F786
VTRALAAAALLALAAGAGAAEPHRFALVAGAPDGGPGTAKLRYAERDARRIHGILTRVGGVRPEDARLILSGSAGELMRALGELSDRAGAARARGERTVLLVYYSGHAKDGALRLGSGRVPFGDLRAALEAAPADVRVGLVDSCRSGAIARAKGVRPAPAFDVSAAEEGPRGLVLIASSAGDEDSQESDTIGASWFTHHLASGLLGAADASGDGRVTLAEAYAYAYARTVGSTASSAGGVQHPVFLYDLGGSGDLVLTDLAPVAGGLLLPAAAEGLYVVLDGAGRAVAEVAKGAGVERRVALPAGRYTVKKRLADDSALLVAPVAVTGAAPAVVDDARMDRVRLDRDPQKGFSGTRWALLAGLGAQRFFDRAARDGLFPPAALGGLELAVRDDLGRGLAWGIDAALGGGAGTLRMPGVEPIPVKFAEIAGGASLWKDLVLGPVVLSAGARIGLTFLGRSFPAREELPSQTFFTVTPGLVGGAAWRASPRLAAVARLRLSYLFYNVDENRSLGFVEGMLGVEYALGE